MPEVRLPPLPQRRWATSNQNLLQRTLGAKDVRNAQLGMLLGGALKLIAVFVPVFPGILAFKLMPGIDPDRAYPALIQEVLPSGFSGIVLAGFIAAIVSTLDSSIMSLSSVFTNDSIRCCAPGPAKNARSGSAGSPPWRSSSGPSARRAWSSTWASSTS